VHEEHDIGTVPLAGTRRVLPLVGDLKDVLLDIGKVDERHVPPTPLMRDGDGPSTPQPVEHLAIALHGAGECFDLLDDRLDVLWRDDLGIETEEGSLEFGVVKEARAAAAP